MERHADRPPRLAWWGANVDVVTGQSIVTRRVIGLMHASDVLSFGYHQRGWRSVLSALGSTVRLAGAVALGRLDTIYLVCSRSNGGFLRDVPAYFSRLFGVRVLVHTHGSDIVDLCQRPGWGRWARFFLSRCEVIVPSEHLLGPLHALGIRQVHLCENFAQPTPTTRASTHQPSTTWQVLWNSNVMASKGFFELARAIGALAGEGLPVRLLAMGRLMADEEMGLAECQQAVAALQRCDWFEWRGPVNRETALSLLHEADLVALPSRYVSECQPLAIIEAMCAARLVLVADTPALRATLGTYPGILVSPTDPIALQAALQRLIAASDTRPDTTEAARFAAQRFSIDRFDRQMAALLRIKGS
jgi:glycosyltransferase involved in cell wall biosynthesis